MGKRHDHKEKHEHERARHRHHRRHQRRSGRGSFFIVAIIIAVLLIVGVAVFVVSQGRGNPSPGTLVPSLGNRHISDINAAGIQYNSDPPTSGPHYGTSLAPWGIHTEPIAKGLMIHNLEDGGVVVSYNPRASPETVDQLAQIVKRYPQHVILAPYPGLGSTIALTAWQRIDKLDTVDEGRIVRFIDAYQGIDHHVK